MGHSGAMPVDFEYADLRGRVLCRTDLRGARMRRADLREADLTGADLRGADLAGADLREAKFQGADLRGADLQEALTVGVDFRDARWDDHTRWPEDVRPASIAGLVYCRNRENVPGGAWRWAFWGVGLGILGLDQVSKLLVEATLPLEARPVWLLPGLLFLQHVRNDGAMLGLSFGGQPFTKLLAIGTAGLIMLGYVPRLYSGRPIVERSALGCALLLAGALGNLIDRVRIGKVTDFIGLEGLFIFNLADVAVGVGLVFLMASGTPRRMQAPGLQADDAGKPPAPVAARRRPAPVSKSPRR